jgi:hypothetical protein
MEKMMFSINLSSFPRFIRFHWSLYDFANNIKNGHTFKDNSLDELFKQCGDIQPRLDKLLEDCEPIFQKKKYLFLLGLNKKINVFMEQYNNLKKAMTKGGISIDNINSFVRNGNSTFIKKFRREGILTKEVALSADEIIAYVLNFR